MVEPDDRSRPGLWIDKDVQEDNTLTYFERMVLAELIYYHKYGDTGCHPSNGHFAKKYTRKKHFISYVFAELQRKGHIKCEPIWENGRIIGRLTTPINRGGSENLTYSENLTGVVRKSDPNKESNKEYKETNKEKPMGINNNLPKDPTKQPQETEEQRRQREFDEQPWNPTSNTPTAGLPTEEQIAAKRNEFYEGRGK